MPVEGRSREGNWERVEAVERCADGAARYRELALDRAAFQAVLCGRPLRLTKREFEILLRLLSAPPGRVFSRRELSEAGWEGGAGGRQASVCVHISHLRKKIREIAGEEYIETVRGRGFRLV